VFYFAETSILLRTMLNITNVVEDSDMFETNCESWALNVLSWIASISESALVHYSGIYYANVNLDLTLQIPLLHFRFIAISRSCKRRLTKWY
jgi:hypothetical protein